MRRFKGIFPAFLTLMAFLPCKCRAATLVEETDYATGRVRCAFISTGMNARAVAMGEAYTAVADDASAISWNPAGLIYLDSLEVIGMYDSMGNGMGMGYISAAAPVSDLSLGASISGFTFGEYVVATESGDGTGSALDLALSIGAAFPNHLLFNISGATGVALEVISEQDLGVQLGATIGTAFYLGESLSVGGAIRHLGLPRDGFSLPATFCLGAAYEASSRTILAADLGYGLVSEQTILSLGVEVIPHPIFAFRLGYRWRANEQELGGIEGIAAGIGFSYDVIGLDYAYQPYGKLANSHRLMMAYRPREVRFGKASIADEPKGEGQKAAVKAADRAPLDADAEYMAALALYSSGQYGASAMKLEGIILFFPGHWQALMLLGNCRYAQQDWAGAIEAYERSLKYHPDNPQLREWLGNLRTRLGAPAP